MSEIFDIPESALVRCQRQGDLLFCPEKIPTDIDLEPQEKWEIRESHEIWSPGLQRNGRYIKSDREIVVTHSSHDTLVLAAGEYRIYASRIEDAD